MFQPTTFGKYFLTRRIAIGGMAEVYAAKLYGADGFEKDLVIKQILPQYARDPEFVQSFVAEAKIAVSLNHANIVGIYELGRVEGTYFIAMEYVDGLDVFQLLDYARKYGRKVGPGLALLVAEEVSKGLDYAHRKVGPDGEPLRLVHRDLNPRNVLISREGEVKILDFGIAKTGSAVAAMPKTRAGVVKGTTGYMSPEQAVGLDVDARTDIYQAGLLLHEMLTGQPLFWRPDDETTRSLMRAHKVFNPSERNPLIPTEIDELCVRLLARTPEARVATASELAQQLARLRYLLFPDEDHRRLGDLATELLQLRAEEETKTELAPISSVPNTMELSDVISKAIEHTIQSDVETIATRFSSPEPGAAPLQVKSDSTLEETPALGVPRPATGQAAIVRDEHAVFPSTEARAWDGEVRELTGPTVSVDLPAPARPPRKGWALTAVAAAIIGVGALSVWILRGDRGTPVANAEAARSAPSSQAVSAPSSSAETPAETPPAESAPTQNESREAERPEKSPEFVAETQRPPRVVSSAPAEPSRRPGPPARIAFGTRSCSSRVSVDGQVVARSTPSYDHPVPPGRHRIAIEGVNCPPMERPGSLRRAIPMVVQDVEVRAGRRYKIIADFETDQLVVRGQ